MKSRGRSLLAATLMALSAVPATAGGIVLDARPDAQPDAQPDKQAVTRTATSAVSAAPEPYLLLLYGTALIGLGLRRRRRRTTMNVAGGSE